ncbi:phosphoesterase [Lachnospiraceae bacterium KM106-2]|nr:phosphoesterase [Lachnospiraceae bacterium KM106-2]
MKILVVSDSHGRNTNLNRIIDKVSPIDLLIHLGDIEEYEDEIELIAGCKTEMVAGNNDYFSKLPKEKVIEIGDYRIFITHGHRYGVYYGTEQLKEAAREHGATIALYGHTHIPYLSQSGDVTVMNPGSVTLPRQDGRVPSYGILEIDRKGIMHFNLNYL